MPLHQKPLPPEEAWLPFEPTAAQPFGRREAAHLFRRAGFAASSREVDETVKLGPHQAVKKLVAASEGEFANTNPNEPLMILGEVTTLQVRADVDEQNAPLVHANQPAVAFLKGSTRDSLPLRFVRIEPFVIPKRSLTGDSTERVDTRVLQIIFELDRPGVPLYVGQQVDVFIQRPPDKVVVSTNAAGLQSN